MSTKKDPVNESRYERPEALRLGTVAQGVGQSCGVGGMFQSGHCNPTGNDAGQDCFTGNTANAYCYTGEASLAGCSGDGNGADGGCYNDGDSPD